jgi:hypothetical protein
VRWRLKRSVKSRKSLPTCRNGKINGGKIERNVVDCRKHMISSLDLNVGKISLGSFFMNLSYEHPRASRAEQDISLHVARRVEQT